MHRFIEISIRGGVSLISQQFIAVNKDIGNFHPSQTSGYNMHWNANNLYGCSMSEILLLLLLLL